MDFFFVVVGWHFLWLSGGGGWFRIGHFRLQWFGIGGRFGWRSSCWSRRAVFVAIAVIVTLLLDGRLGGCCCFLLSGDVVSWLSLISCVLSSSSSLSTEKEL
jgi:hypothetical protein